jgi:hypothetical protein
MNGMKTRGKNGLLVLIIILIAMVGCRLYVRQSYLSTIHTRGLITDFHSANDTNVRKLQQKYSVEYIHIRGKYIIGRSNTLLLQNIDLIPFAVKKSRGVLPYSTVQGLEGIEPYVFLHAASLYILFPLVFDDTDDSYLIMKRIL